MPRASRKCCTLALLPWAAPLRGRSSCITHRWYVSCAHSGSGGRTQGPQGQVQLTLSPCTECCNFTYPCLLIHSCQKGSHSPLSWGLGWGIP